MTAAVAILIGAVIALLIMLVVALNQIGTLEAQREYDDSRLQAIERKLGMR